MKWLTQARDFLGRHRERLTIAALLLAAALAWGGAWRNTHPTLTVTFLDVGQGDAILIQGPERTVLMDAGGVRGADPDRSDVGREVVLPALLLAGVRRIDALILSHAHDDHAAGAVSVVGQVPVGMLVEPELPSPALGYQRLLLAAEWRNVPRVAARAGQVMRLGGGALLYVLHPPLPRVGGTEADLNNNSVIVKVVFGSVSFLLTGDVEDTGETALLQSHPDLRSTVLKVPHHGAATSTTAALLDAVRPQLAVISVGENTFGHPSGAVLRRLEKRGVRVLRTDVSGAVTVRTDGRRLWVDTYR